MQVGIRYAAELTHDGLRLLPSREVRRSPGTLSASNTGLVLLCEAAEVAAGEMKRVTLRGLEPLAVYHLDDGFYVTDDTCTHGQASLAQGCVEHGEVECPAHGGRFEIRTGIAVGFPAAVSIRYYQAKVSDGTVYAAEVLIPEAVPSESKD